MFRETLLAAGKLGQNALRDGFVNGHGLFLLVALKVPPGNARRRLNYGFCRWDAPVCPWAVVSAR